MSSIGETGKLLDEVETDFELSSDPFFVEHVTNCGVQIVTDNGDSAGNVFIEQSNNGTDWVPRWFADPGGTMVESVPILAGENSIFVDVNNLCCRWIKARWAPSSGNASLLWVNALRKKNYT